MDDNYNMTTMKQSDNMPFDINLNKYIETPWKILQSYFDGEHLERLVRHQLESYNNFVSYQLFKTIDMFNPLRVVSEQDYHPDSKQYALEIFITFENLKIYRPQIHENNGAVIAIIMAKLVYNTYPAVIFAFE